MASGAQQLSADFEQVKKQLSRYPNIIIIETEGDPPDRYDIEYNVKGYKTNDDGTVSPANSHKIRITLPFGYPHFSPIVKPLTPVFHPDIDPDAIRIADFWQDNKSLGELILHIGKMICGICYQKEKPFNQDAFEWFENRQDWLPFDTLEPTDTEEQQEDGGKAEPVDSEEFFASEEQMDKVSSDATHSADESLDILKEDLSLIFDEDESEEIDVDLFEEDQESPEDDLTFALDFEEEDESAAGHGSDEIIDLTGDDEEIPLSLEEDERDESETVKGIELEDLAGIEEDESLFTIADEKESDEGISLDFLGEEPESPAAGEEEQPLTLATEKSEEPSPAEELQPVAPEKRIEEEDIPLSQDETSSEEIDIPIGIDTESSTVTEKEAEIATTVEDESLAGLELDDDFQTGPDTTTGGGKVRSIRPLIEQKKIFTAKKVLADITDPGSVPDLEELEQHIADAIAQAEELHKKADKLEQKGEFEKAGLILDLIANVAVDYPGLEFGRNRIRESLLSKDSKQETQSSREEGTNGAPAKKKKAKTKSGFKLPYKVIAIVIVLVGILTAATLVTIKDSDNLKLAYSNFQKAEQFLENKEYKEAKKALDEAALALDQILALQKKEKATLLLKIKVIADSQSFKEGLQGRVLYNDRYVTVEMAKNIDKFNSLMVNAETQQNSGNIEEALKFYEQAGQTARQIGFEEQEKTIHQTMNSLHLKQTLGRARKAEEEQEWEQAAETYAKALELSKNLSTPDDKNEIESRLAAAAFRHELVEGQRAFTSSDWQKTIEMLQGAQKILETNPQIASESEKGEIHKLLINSRLYHILSGAKNAFEMKEWELAVNEYKNAIYLLENNKKVLGDKAEVSINKIEKTILMTEIAREQSENSLAVDKNDLQASLDNYRAIASLIENSSFSEDDTLRKILENSRTQMAVLVYEIKINSRIDWLEQNYDEIFRKMYPSAKSSELLNPRVDFIREEGDKLVFTMSCVEKKQGRSFTLELNYQYDQKKDSWGIYSGTL